MKCGIAASLVCLVGCSVGEHEVGIATNALCTIEDQEAGLCTVGGGIHCDDVWPNASWINPGPFTCQAAPAGRSVSTAWRSGGPIPAVASFGIQIGQQMTIAGLQWDAYGSGSSGLGSVDVFYYPPSGQRVQIAGSYDLGRGRTWGVYAVPGLQAQAALPGGRVVVNLEVDVADYFIGRVSLN